ncbi:MAG: redoxin domain-containing protein [Bacteroidales bacterium]|nr:redoxin domain-containing protein [Bacteroidales bacterium]
MKNHFFTLLAIIALMAACSSNPYSKSRPYVVEGSIASWDSGWIYLQFREQGQFITIDSLHSTDGNFLFKSEITYPKLAYIRLEGVNRPISFFLDAGNIHIAASSDQIADARITGSPPHDIYKKYMDENKVYTDRAQELYKEYEEAKKAGDNDKIKELTKEHESIGKQEVEHLLGFVNANTKSVVAAQLTLRNIYRLELADMETVAKNLDPTLAGSEYVVQLKEKIELLHGVQIGKTAPEFTMNDSIGNPVSLSSLRGSYLLIDFWAAWCGPCRVENPNVVAAYQKYHEKGFDILGVSLDNDRDRWIKAIHDDQLTWHHISDLKGWSNEAAKLYAVNSIPASVLLDPQGVIIGRNLREQALHEKLEELFSASMAGK